MNLIKLPKQINTIFAVLGFLTILSISSCKSNPEEKLVGKWIQESYTYDLYNEDYEFFKENKYLLQETNKGIPAANIPPQKTSIDGHYKITNDSIYLSHIGMHKLEFLNDKKIILKRHFVGPNGESIDTKLVLNKISVD